MKLITATMIALLIAGSSAYASSCGPSLEPYAEINNSDSGGLRQKVGIKYKIPLGNSCDKVKAEAEKKAAEAIEQRIQNLERLVRICNGSPSLPVCETLDQLSMELYQK